MWQHLQNIISEPCVGTMQTVNNHSCWIFGNDCVVLLLIMYDRIQTHNNIIQIIMHCLHICMPSLHTYIANIINTVSFPLCVEWYPEIKAAQKKTVPIYEC